MRALKFSPLLLSALCALGGCSNGFDPLSYLSGLRLMVVGSQPAQANGGDQVTLTALAIDTAGQPISYEWSICNLANTLVAGGSVNQDCVTADGGASLTPVGTGNPITFKLPAIDLSSLGVQDETFGLYLPIRLTIRAPGINPGDAPREVDGIYKMRITPPPLPPPLPPYCVLPLPNGEQESPVNHDPTLAGIWVVPASGNTFGNGPAPTVEDGAMSSTSGTDDMGDMAAPFADAGIPPVSVELPEGQPLEIQKGQTWSLRALFTNDSFEHYCGVSDTAMPPVADKTEILSVRWFATAGKFDAEVSGQETATNFSMTDKIPAASGTPIDLFAVGHDERGGTTWLHRTLIYR